MNTPTPKTPIQQIADWLETNKKDIKKGGLAEAAGLNKGTLSRLLTGKRTAPRKSTVERLLAAAITRGFKPQ